MYQEEYKRWLAADLEDADLKPELSKIEGNDDEIKERFAVALKFGTAGLRGVLGAGTNRMNIYVVRQATQGLANWVKTQGGTQTVAISYDSRLKSDVFAKTAAGVLAANGIKVRIYDALMPVPALSFATRYYNCNAGVMVTASHASTISAASRTWCRPQAGTFARSRGKQSRARGQAHQQKQQVGRKDGPLCRPRPRRDRLHRRRRGVLAGRIPQPHDCRRGHLVLKRFVSRH